MKPKTVKEYIANLPPEKRAKFRQMRAAIKAALPKAVEEIKWGMPAFSSRRILVMYAAFKNHIGLYPTASAVAAFKKELSKYKSAKGSIQFPLDQALPVSLIKKIARFRLKESLEQDQKWRSKKA